MDCDNRILGRAASVAGLRWRSYNACANCRDCAVSRADGFPHDGCDCHAYPPRHANAGGGSYSGAHRHTHNCGYPYRNASANTSPDKYANTHAYPNCNADSYSGTHPHAHLATPSSLQDHDATQVGQP